MKGGDFAARYRKLWGELGPYDKFEHAVALILMLLISLVIAAATASLAIDVGRLLAGGPAHYNELGFEEIFGRIMTVLIALEFNVSIAQVLTSRRHILQVRTVVLVAILAIARKFIIIDLETNSAEMIVALAVTAAALALAYWIIVLAERHSETPESGDDEG